MLKITSGAKLLFEKQAAGKDLIPQSRPSTHAYNVCTKFYKGPVRGQSVSMLNYVKGTEILRIEAKYISPLLKNFSFSE